MPPDTIDAEWAEKPAGGDSMRLKVINEDVTPAILLEADPVADSGIIDWISRQGNNLWSWIAGGVSHSTSTNDKDGKSITNVTEYTSGNNASNAAANATANTIAKNASGTVNMATKDSLMQKLSNTVKPDENGTMKNEWLGKQMASLGDFISKNPQTTAIGLGAAGLLGTYYLWKKFTGKKALTKNDFDEARKIDATAKRNGMTPQNVTTL